MTRSRSITGAMILIVIGLSHTPLRGDDFTVMQKKLVKELWKGGNYFEVVTEVKRLLFFDKDQSSVCEYRFLAGAAYYMGTQYKSAAISVSAESCDADSAKGKSLIAMSLLSIGQHGAASALLDSISYDAVDPAYRFRLLTFKLEALARRKEYAPLHAELEKAGPFIAGEKRMKDLASFIEEHGKGYYKSPTLAVTLSAVLPGSGQAYAGMPLQGLLSFLGVVLTGGGAWLLYRSGYKDLSYVSMGFSALFYAGNIYGAYNAAEKWNGGRLSRFLEGFHEKAGGPYSPEKEFGGSRVLH